MASSRDRCVAADLIDSLEDGRRGFEHAAQRLAGSNRLDLSRRFEEFARQRCHFATELESLSASCGGADEDGEITDGLHRCRSTVVHDVAGAGGVLDAALADEHHTISDYRDALDRQISGRLRDTIARQLAAIEAVRAEIEACRCDAG